MWERGLLFWSYFSQATSARLVMPGRRGGWSWGSGGRDGERPGLLCGENWAGENGSPLYRSGGCQGDTGCDQQERERLGNK